MTSRRSVLPSEVIISKRKSGVQVLMPFQKDVVNMTSNNNTSSATTTANTTNNNTSTTTTTSRIGGTLVKRRASTAAAALAAAGGNTNSNAFPMYTTAASTAQQMSTRPHSGPLVTVGVGRRAAQAAINANNHPHAASPLQLAWTNIGARVMESSASNNNKAKLQPGTIAHMPSVGVPVGGATAATPAAAAVSSQQPIEKRRSRSKVSSGPNTVRKTARASAVSPTGATATTTTTPASNPTSPIPSRRRSALQKKFSELSTTDSNSTTTLTSSPPSTTTNTKQRPSTFFDPFCLMYPTTSPEHLLSSTLRRFIVGKLSCKLPGTCHFKRDRLCYMFIHPQSSDIQVMMELWYNDMTDLKVNMGSGKETTNQTTTLSAYHSSTTSSSIPSFSFKVPHHLPAFHEGQYGDYEPHLRSHRITLEFTSQKEVQMFKSMVLANIQQVAIKGKKGMF